jgi:hypothetical protein
MRLLLFSFLLSTVAFAEAATPFEFAVYRTKLPRHESGQLTINESGISYRSENGKTSLTLPFLDIREADLSDPVRITLTTYDIAKLRLGGNRVISFRLREGAHAEDLARYFSEHLKRPVVGAYALPDEGAVEIPAYHRELLGGSHGTLLIGPDGIRFVSKKAKESRTWLYQDINTIGSGDPFHFRLSTSAETYTLDLKERLPESAYRLASQRVYNLGLERRSSWTDKH